ncbi:hypothetical protein F511_46313 [Dorcoceras hygrometricum]|uniref:Uncharacterized protein n=1 Tax=Dorcoceras hygrometricum TaxID=472368 RepID=A0A2Z7A0U6_9LAMI|nr:hypothetical protein F511_46313 [Dorcoceras hygrometricum]
MQRGCEDFNALADFQGENQPVLPQANNPCGERNFSSFGGYKKVISSTLSC